MKTLKYIAMAVCCLTLVGCEDFLDVNQTQDSPVSVTLDQVLPVATFYAAQINYDHAEYGVYMSQALTTQSKSQTGSYPYSQGWEFLGVNRHPQWRRHFYDLGANIDKMKAMAIERQSYNYELIGRTIMLQSTMMTTDIFADMPRKEAYLATSPKYDSQAEIYEWMFEEADKLVELYNDPAYAQAATNLPISEKTDRIYKGDIKKWGAYAKALRCRLWLRKLPNWDPSAATCQRIITMVDEVLADPNWEEPRYNYPSGKAEQNCPWGVSAPVINSWESRGNRLATSIPTTFFAKGILSCYNNYVKDRGYALDPRAEKIMTPRSTKGLADGTQDAYMRWLESNIGMDVSEKTTWYPDLLTQTAHTNPYTADNGYIALITEEELLFIKAEAQMWAGDVNGAYNTTVAAVLKNFERYGVQTTGLTGKGQIRYDRFWEVKLSGAAEFTLADLMQQKYVAMYLQAEQWTDLRRYNYSSSSNDLRYQGVYVYLVKTCHDGKKTLFEKDNFKVEYALRRPYNLYEAYWEQDDCYKPGTDRSVLSDKAWVNRLNPDTETEVKYNRDELIRIGACDASGKVDYHWMQKKMIWQ